MVDYCTSLCVFADRGFASTRMPFLFRGKLTLQCSKLDSRRISMAKRTASAVWEGNLREGKGKVKLGSGAFEGQYSFSSRFEEGTGTNPEELIGAAHAGCFSMALAAGLTKAGLKARRISTNANVDRKS